jgi:hypothetical protein
MVAKDFIRVVPKYMAQGIEQGLEGEWEQGRFSGFLKCNATFCGELVVVAGDYWEREFHQYDETTQEDVAFTDRTYSPQIMHPPPPIINIPRKLRAEAVKQIKLSFGLLWSDPGACANRLRIVVELLLDQLGIEREGEKGRRKNARLDLFDRIEILGKSKPGHEKALNALRYVGNVGSQGSGRRRRSGLLRVVRGYLAS